LVRLHSPAAIAVLGGWGRLAHLSVLYMRIAALGLPFALIAVAGQGYLRGLSRLRLPFVLLLAGNLLNGALEVVFVYVLHLGVAGSAWATVIAQVAIALALLATMTPIHGGDWLPDWAALRELAGTVLDHVGSIWPIFALMQPLNAVVFALDGILIGAGDTRYLMWAMLSSSVVAFAPVALASAVLGWG
jgi:Na+-driven multidrug efflux pump